MPLQRLHAWSAIALQNELSLRKSIVFHGSTGLQAPTFALDLDFHSLLIEESPSCVRLWARSNIFTRRDGISWNRRHLMRLGRSYEASEMPDRMSLRGIAHYLSQSCLRCASPGLPTRDLDLPAEGRQLQTIPWQINALPWRSPGRRQEINCPTKANGGVLDVGTSCG